MVRLALATVLAVLAGAGPALAANASVTASNFDFSPEQVTIKAGDKVTWTNTGGTHNVHESNDLFVKPASPSSTAWSEEHTFTTPGTYTYYCDLHGPGMSGTVTVTGTTYTWDGGAGSSSWEDAANWAPDGIPGTSPTDRAAIANAFVNMGGAHTIAGLDLSGGAHRGGSGTLTLTGPSTWTNGNTGPGKTIVSATGQLTWNGGTLTQGEIENLGALAAGGIELGAVAAGGNPAVLDNQGTAVLAGDVTAGNPGQAVVQNLGTLSGTGTVGPPLSNSGTVTAQSGLLELTGSVTPNPGDYAAAAGATLRFTGTTTGETGARVTGAGTVQVAGTVSMPVGDADGWVVPGATRVTGVLSTGGGSTGSLDVDGAFGPALPFVATGGTNTWTGNIAGPAQVTVKGTTTLQGLEIWAATKLRLEGPSTLADVKLGNADVASADAPELLIAGPASVPASTIIPNHTAGGSPRVAILAGGTLNLGTSHLTVAAPVSMAGTLGVQLDSGAAFGRLTAPSAVLGGTLAVSGAFKPVEPVRVIGTPAEPSGAFSGVTDGFEAIRDAGGVLLKAKAAVDPPPPPPPPAPAATVTPVPTPVPEPPISTVTLPRFGTLVKLPKCAARRSVTVRLVAPAASAKVKLGRKLLKTVRLGKPVTLKRLPKRAFTLAVEVRLADGRLVKGGRRFKPCR